MGKRRQRGVLRGSLRIRRREVGGWSRNMVYMGGRHRPKVFCVEDKGRSTITKNKLLLGKRWTCGPRRDIRIHRKELR
jgi:hypothetical protein